MLIQLQHGHHAPVHQWTFVVLCALGGDARHAQVDVGDVSQAVQMEIARRWRLLPQPR